MEPITKYHDSSLQRLKEVTAILGVQDFTWKGFHDPAIVTWSMVLQKGSDNDLMRVNRNGRVIEMKLKEVADMFAVCRSERIGFYVSAKPQQTGSEYVILEWNNPQLLALKDILQNGRGNTKGFDSPQVHAA